MLSLLNLSDINAVFIKPFRYNESWKPSIRFNKYIYVWHHEKEPSIFTKIIVRYLYKLIGPMIHV